MAKQKRILPALVVLGVLVLLILVFVLLVYGAGLRRGFAIDFALDILPLPAAVVDGKLVTLGEVNTRLEAYRSAVEFQTQVDWADQKWEQEMRKQEQQILKRLIEERLLLLLAEERGIVVTQKETDDHFLYLLSGFGIAEDEANERLRQMFGWSAREYKRNVVYPELLRSKLAVALLFENRDRSGAYTELKEVREEALESRFAAVAAEHSEDEATKYIGGELGLLSREELPFWFEDSAFGLEIGEISDIVISPEGYNLLEFGLRDSSREPGRVLLRRILVRDDFLTQALEEYRESAKILVID